MAFAVEKKPYRYSIFESNETSFYQVFHIFLLRHLLDFKILWDFKNSSFMMKNQEPPLIKNASLFFYE